MTLDVQGMLCAQALAVVDQALKPLPPGARVEVHGGSPDVVADLTAWAQDRGHRLILRPEGSVEVIRGMA